MNLTITLTEFLLIVTTIAIVVATVAITRFTTRLGKTADEMEHLARRVGPKAEETLTSLRAELDALRSLTGRCERIADRTDRVVEGISETAVPLMHDVDQLRRSKKYVVAAAKGLWEGVRTLSRRPVDFDERDNNNHNQRGIR